MKCPLWNWVVLLYPLSAFFYSLSSGAPFYAAWLYAVANLGYLLAVVTIYPGQFVLFGLKTRLDVFIFAFISRATAVSAALPLDLSTPAATSILEGPLNLRQYVNESGAYGVSSLAAQGLGFSNLKVGSFEIWNSGWRAADVKTLRSKGINDLLADPQGLYGVTPASPGKKIF